MDCYGKQSDRMGSRGGFVMIMFCCSHSGTLRMEKVKMRGPLWTTFLVLTLSLINCLSPVSLRSRNLQVDYTFNQDGLMQMSHRICSYTTITLTGTLLILSQRGNLCCSKAYMQDN